jgi:hypothetical protein
MMRAVKIELVNGDTTIIFEFFGTENKYLKLRTVKCIICKTLLNGVGRDGT